MAAFFLMKSKRFYNEFLFHFIEEQAKEFEEFGKRMSLELKTFYQEEYNNIYKQQEEKILECKDTKECECKKKIEEQGYLIDSLRSHIEELENKLITMDQDFQKLQINQTAL